MGILDKYSESVDDAKRLLKGEKPMSEYEQDLNEEIQKLRQDPNDLMYQFMVNYPNVNEDELTKKQCIQDENVRVVVRRAYCPECGKELVSPNPLILNPFTGQRIAKHECECGYKANLEYAYPRVTFLNNNNNEEVIAFAR